ncbi:conserved hypothetical protein [Leishmania braziliensis MHOM/BR/75/M2904]|uniref:SET domain-containing protein n=1 Tax=Leishmania braziliensis TaxID=5660 RepID=A4HJ86_LEIBR|nr:conserved hypothetical protein [Leishmania braziliensis MHOM/BR/75/M2904]CAJ2477814.1 unnamed protein product [Leishmania braziliensis]CAM42546.2 conserved hypothetical protein [Leishmania braziliensis MHOM/BR/75/M2904]
MPLACPNLPDPRFIFVLLILVVYCKVLLAVMRHFSQLALGDSCGVCLALRRLADKSQPTGVPEKHGSEVVSEAVPGAGATSLSSRLATNHSGDVVSALSEEVAARGREDHSSHRDFMFQAEWQRTGRHADGGHRRSQPQRSRRRSTRTSFTHDERGSAEAAVSRRDPRDSEELPVVHPGADLPPVPQRALVEKRAGKFSFVSDPSQRASRDFYGNEVPNNTPKPKLPMWASSLTSPALGKVRLVEESWISRDARGVLGENVTAPFVRWLCSSVLPVDSALREQLEANVLLDLRLTTARGVYAKRAFRRGDVVLTIPLFLAAQSEAPSCAAWLTLNSETLARYSTAAQQRVGLPSYNTVKQVISARRSSFDPIPHPLFLDQVCTALLLACEKADGEASPLFPYLRLLSSAELFDDEAIKELHLGVLDPTTYMEYGDHIKRFQHYMRELHAVWWAAYESAAEQGLGAELAGAATATARGSSVPILCMDKEGIHTTAPIDTESRGYQGVSHASVGCADVKVTGVGASATFIGGKPPPSLEDMLWALRVVLSRQKVLPYLRVNRAAFERVHDENDEGEELDAFGKAMMKGKYAFYQHALRAIDEDRLHVNEVDPTAIPTVVPLLDMLSHPPGGVPNVTYTVERIERTGGGTGSTLEVNTSPYQGDLASDTSVSASPSFQVVVRATDDIEEDEELTVSYVKCYSVAYTLYRYGFLPLSRREDDVAALLHANNVDGNLRPAPASGSSPTSPSMGSVLSAVRRWWSSIVV